MKVIILNAPPGCGKDTIGYAIKSRKPHYELLSFKRPMFEFARAVLGDERYSKFMALYGNRDTKEIPVSWLGGDSPRNFMIWISESIVKPKFGNHHFGTLFAESLPKSNHDVIGVCTDGGFPDEIHPLIAMGHHVQVIRLHREGYTFDGDSRNYICFDETARYLDMPYYQERDLFIKSGEIDKAVDGVLSSCWWNRK